MSVAVATITTMLDAALSYARSYFAVAPAYSIVDGKCQCNDSDCGKQAGKHPRTRNGLTDATTNEKQIREWWTKWPDANILIRTGKQGNRYLVVVDIDPRHGGDKSIVELTEKHGDIGDTLIANTGGDGSHLFLWSNHAVKNSANKVADGVDIRGVGGYVIAPPSLHVSGKRYAWSNGKQPGDLDMAEMPGWLVAAAGTAGSPGVRLRPEDVPDGADVHELFEGGRNTFLTSIAGSMRRPGIGYQAMLAALRVTNDQRCKPPLDDWEVERIARSISKNTPGDPVQVITVDPLQGFGPSEIYKPLPDVPWVIQGLGISPGAVTLVSGSAGSGKTFCMQSLLLSIAAGEPVFGTFNIKQGRAVHFDYEQGRHLTIMRYQQLGNGMKINFSLMDERSLDVCTMPSVYMKNDKATEDILSRKLEGASVCLIDAFRGAFPSALENDSSVRSNLDMLQRVSERTGCTIIVIMHSGRTVEGRDIRDSMRGSSALTQSAQTVFMVDGDPKDPTKPKRFHNTKTRYLTQEMPTFGVTLLPTGPTNENGIVWGATTGWIDEVATEAAYSPKEDPFDIRRSVASHETLVERITRLIAMSPGQTNAQIRQALSVNAFELKAALDTLYQKGIATSEGKGGHATWYIILGREPGED